MHVGRVDTTAHRVRTRHQRAALLIALLLAATVAACGTRRSHAEMLADARGPATNASDESVGSGQNAGAVGPTATTTPGDSAASGTTGAATASGSATRTTAAAGGGSVGAPAPETCAKALSAITIATVGQQSGLVGAAVLPGVKAVQAWVGWINDRGGIRCHPIRYLVLDDGGDPARSQALLRQAVEQQGAVALVGGTAVLTADAQKNYIVAHRVPVIGDIAGHPIIYQTPMHFPQGIGAPNNLTAAMAVAADVGVPKGLTRLGTLACIEAAACSGLNDLAVQHAADFGLTSVYRGSISIAQPDYSSQCQAAQAAGAQILVMTADANSIERLARSCASVNYRPLYGTLTAAAAPQLTGNPQLEGMTASQSVLPWMIGGNPALEEYRDAMKQYAPSVEPQAAATAGWVSAKIFELAAQRISANPTSAEILDGLWGIKDNDIGGLTYPLTFNRDQKPPAPLCYFGVQIQNGKYVPTNGGKLSCR